jgi:hypothetical protein
VDVFVWRVVDVFVFTVADAFGFIVVDAFVSIPVVGTGVVFTVAGTVVFIVVWVGRAVGDSGLPVAGVAADDWFIPGIIPVMKAAAAARIMIAISARRPHFRKGLRLFSCTGTFLLSPGRPETGVTGPVFFREG